LPSLNAFPNPSLDVTVKLALHTPTFKVAGAESKVKDVAVRVTAIVAVALVNPVELPVRVTLVTVMEVTLKNSAAEGEALLTATEVLMLLPL
jgi:hypothetical protein